ncbi:MAG: hypothetical protein IPI23_13345 [Bacteroidetes bacterium]|nr:hypothetical protein [Bacteroidota bacterium]
MIEKQISQSYINQLISALKILFVQILHREWDPIAIPRARLQKKLPVVLSTVEVERLLHALSNLKHRTLLYVAYSSGLRLENWRALN